MVNIEEVRQRAMRAQERARKALATQWAPFVRMYSRNSKMKVALTAGTPRTDGKTTWLRVPIELGDDTPHNKVLCGTRDRNKGWTMLCPSCDIFDDANCTILHEAGHCTEGSFDSVSEDERKNILVRAIAAEGTTTERYKLIEKRVQENIRFVTNYKSAANLVSPFLPFITNVVEDVWVNDRVMEYRPGTRRQFAAKYYRIFERGVEDFFGETVSWNERPLNSQIGIGVLCMGSKLSLEGKLHEKVVHDLTTDEEINLLVKEIDNCYTAELRYKLAIKFLEAFRRLGYCLSSDDPPDPKPEPGKGEAGGDEPQEGGEEETDDQSESGDEESEGGTQLGAGDSDDGEDSDESEDFEGCDGVPQKLEGDTPDEGGEETTGTGTTPTNDLFDDDIDQDDPGFPPGLDFGTPEEANDDFQKFGQHDKDDPNASKTGEEIIEEEELERALSQGEHFSEPSDHLVGLRVVLPGEGGAFEKTYPHPINIPASVLNPALLKARITFTNNKKGKRKRDLDSGTRLDGQVLGRRLAVGDHRVFESRSRLGKRDYAVCLGVDVSGSTSGYTVELEKECAYAQIELLSKLGVRTAVYAHTGRGGAVLIHQVKTWDEPWGENQKEAFSTLGAHAANLDGHTLEFYRKALDQVNATDKIMLYYTDGAMPCENYVEELDVLQREIRICQQKGYYLLGVGIRNDDPLRHGLDMVRLDTIEDVPNVVEALRQRLI